MDKNTAINNVIKFSESVRTRFDAEMIVLYGSFAKENYIIEDNKILLTNRKNKSRLKIRYNVRSVL